MHYRQMIDKLGLTQVGAAHFLGIGPRSSRRWASGSDIEVPLVVRMLLRVMIRYGITVDKVNRLVGRPETSRDYTDQRHN